MRRVALAAVALLAACKSASPEPLEPLEPPTRFSRADAAIVKARRGGDDALYVLVEVPAPIADVERPRRALERHGRAGAFAAYAPPDGVVLADVAAHPSGAASLLLVDDAGYAIARWPLGEAAPRAPVRLVDDAVGGDPSDVPPVAALLPPGPSRDAGRLAPLGEELAVVVRTATSSVVAYRLAADGAPTWRRLVEPGIELEPTLLRSGSFDTFGQLAGRFHVHADSDESGALHIALPTQRAFGLLDAHARAFGESLAALGGAAGGDVLVTRLGPDGSRGPTRVVGTAAEDEPYGARVVGDAFVVVGRTETRPDDAFGWDGLLVRVDADGAEASRVEIDRGEVLFDAAPAPGGRLVVVGGAGYGDNPSGASISEECALLAIVLDGYSPPVRLGLPSQPRHSHLRAALPTGDGAVWVAGQIDGPGTHSGDADPTLIRAAPFATRLSF